MIVADAWAPAAPEADVFAHMRPADAECDPELGYQADALGGDPSFEINTGWCNYLTVSQPLLTDVGEGDPIKLLLWHFELFSMEPDASAYVGLAIDSETVWEQTIPIPSPSRLEIGEFLSPMTIDAGADVQFHLHNHGINSWDLLTIRVTN